MRDCGPSTNISAIANTTANTMATNANARIPLVNYSYFATTPTPQVLGFSTTAQAIAANNLAAVPKPDFERLVHTDMYKEVMQPLQLGQNAFVSVNSERDSKRLENILGGWVADAKAEERIKWHEERRGMGRGRGNGTGGEMVEEEGQRRGGGEGQGRRRGKGGVRGRGGQGGRKGGGKRRKGGMR